MNKQEKQVLAAARAKYARSKGFRMVSPSVADDMAALKEWGDPLRLREYLFSFYRWCK